nr:MAG: sigma-70 family RNA polymerase sigma factor [Pseudomonadota bacterium]
MMKDARKTAYVDDASAGSAVEASRVTAATIPFAKLVSDNLDFVWRCLRRFGVRPADVDDAAQQVFLIANEKLASIRPGSERSFLVGVATRVASHSRRATQRREAAQQRLSGYPPQSPDPEALARQAEARDLLDRVLDKMSSELRSVFVLFELEELTIDEVANLLGLPRGTVATRLRRARMVFQNEVRSLERFPGGREP